MGSERYLGPDGGLALSVMVRALALTLSGDTLEDPEQRRNI